MCVFTENPCLDFWYRTDNHEHHIIHRTRQLFAIIVRTIVLREYPDQFYLLISVRLLILESNENLSKSSLEENPETDYYVSSMLTHPNVIKKDRRMSMLR